MGAANRFAAIAEVEIEPPVEIPPGAESPSKRGPSPPSLPPPDSPSGAPPVAKTQALGQECPRDPDFDSVEWKALLAYEAHAGCPKGLRLCVKQIPTQDGAVNYLVNYEEWASLYDEMRDDGTITHVSEWVGPEPAVKPVLLSPSERP